MDSYKNMFLALFITLQVINYASLPKISKHWNNGFNRKKSGVYRAHHREKSHAW